MKINLMPKKTVKQTLWKTINIVSSLALIANMTMVGVFLTPHTAQAAESGNSIIIDEEAPPEQYSPKTLSSGINSRSATDADPVGNPPLGQSCGLDIGLVFDGSGSISSTEYNQMKSAFNSFVSAFLPGTPTQMAIVEFASGSVIRQAFTDNDTTLHDEINEPRVQPGGQYTNWEAGLSDIYSLYDPRTAKPDVIVFASDGNPNYVGTSYVGEAAAMTAAVAQANAIKSDGIRIIALGIGNGLDVANLQAISGPTVAPPASIDENADVIKADFDTLAAVLANLADELCGGKILVQKQIDTDGDGQADIDGSDPNAQLADWQFNVNGESKTTDNTGSLEFDIDTGTYSVTEVLRNQYALENAYCVKGNEPIGAFNQTNGVDNIVVNTEDTVSCTFINHPLACNLQITKEVSASSAAPGDTLTYTLDYTNIGDGDCTGGGARIDDFIPSGTTYVSGSNTQTVQNDTDGQSIHFGYAHNKFGTANPTGFNGSLLSWNAHVVSPGESGRVTFQVTVDEINPCSEININNHGTIYSNELPNGVISNEVSTLAESACFGSLKVIKNVNANGSTNPATPDQWDFTIDGFGTKTPNQGKDFVVFDSLPAGTYTVTESSILGYYQSSTTCNNIAVNPNEQSQCEFTNTRDAGDLKIYKVDEFGDPMDVEVTVDGSEFYDQEWTGNDGLAYFPTVPTGTYVVTENSPAGYTASGWECSISGGVQTWSGLGAEIDDVLIMGDYTTTCTFTNVRDTGTIVVHKDVVAPDGVTPVTDNQAFTVKINGANPETITESANVTYDNLPTGDYLITEELIDPDYSLVSITNGGNATVTKDQTTHIFIVNQQHEATITVTKNVLDPDGNEVADGHEFIARVNGQSDTIAEGNNAVFHVWPGNYTVTEDPDPNYDLVSIIPENFTLVSGGSITVDVTNKQKKAEVNIYKDVRDNQGNDISDNHYFGLNTGAYSISENDSLQLFVNPGTYTYSEDSDPNYTLDNIVGDNDADPSNGAAFTVSSNGNKSLTFVNYRNSGTIIVNKFVEYADGSTQTNPDNWSWSLDSESGLAGGTQKTLLTNQTYSVAEDTAHYPQDNFTTTWICWEGDQIFSQGSGTSFDIAVTENNQNIVCTFTNSRDTTDITFDKIIVGNGPADDYDWYFSVDGQGAYQEGDIVTLPTNSGPYTVAETSQYDNLYTLTKAWGACRLDSGNIVLNVGSELSTCYVENTRNTGNISGKKYEDMNGNGQPDTNEPFVAGVTINLSNGWTTATDADGSYTFNNVPTGNYDVSEIIPNGWINTTQDSFNINVAKDSTIGVWFGNFRPGTISGYKYNDLNGNGIWDKNQNEPALAGWTINLSGPVNDSATTGSNGYYEFTGLTAGTYSLTEDLKTGWLQTEAPNDVLVQSGTNSTDNDFGNFELGKISGYKFNDLNGNGIWDKDNGEPALNDWEICYAEQIAGPALLSAAPGDETAAPQSQPACVLTGAGDWNDGYYEFTGIMAGGYSVWETLKNGWTQTLPTNPENYSVAITSGTVADGNDFGNFENADVTVYKYIDSDGDSGTTGDRTAQENWDVDLDGDHQLTASDGSYTWTNLGPGTYTVSETFNTDDYMALTPTSYTFTVESGADETLIFRNFEYGMIYGTKYDNTETPLANWKICLNNQTCTLTDSNGYYEFTGLTGGTYSINEIMKDGWRAVMPASGQYTGIEITSGLAVQKDFMNERTYPDLTVTKTDGLESAAAGDTLTYTIVVTNQGEYKAEGITVTDRLPDYVTYVSDNTGVAPTVNAGEYTWEFPSMSLDVGESYSFELAVEIDAVISPAGTHTLLNYVEVSTQSEESNTNNNSDTDETAVTTIPVLGVDKQNDANDPVAPGASVHYTIFWSVSGNSKATNVTLVDAIPAELTVDTNSITNSGVYDEALRTITWDLGTQTPLATGFVSYDATVASPLTNGTDIINIAKLSSHESDPQFAEDDSKVTVVSGPKLTIDKAVNVAEDSFVNPGDTITYSVLIKNIGDDTATNLELTDLLPSNFTFVEFGSGIHTWSLGDLTAGKEISISYDVLIDEGMPAGFYDNFAVASADNHENVTDTKTIEVRVPKVLAEEAKPALEIVKTADKEFINAGDAVTYTIKVTNIGDAFADAVAINVQVQDVMPAGFTFEDGSVTKLWALGDLAIGESKEISYTALTDKTLLRGRYDNLAVAWADNHGKISDTGGIDVREPIVLGAELPVTGASAIHYLYFFTAGLLLIFSIYMLRQTRSKERI